MKTSRRSFIKSISFGTIAASTPLLSNLNCFSNKKPNILFIMSDDHAEQAISSYGSKMINTPNIDRIANEGIRYENSFVTNSICAPSRAVLLTGKYSHLNGLRDNRDEFDGSQQTFPKLLQQQGYYTAIIGKWHLKTTPTGFNKHQILIGQGEYYNPNFIENGEKKQYTGYTTDLITDFAINTLDQLDKGTPFCMLVHNKAPHRNWMPNSKHLGAFDDIDIPLPETFYDDYKGRHAAAAADMRIDDMYLSHDLKLHRETIKKESGSGGNKEFSQNALNNWENQYKRLNAEQKQAWDAYYDKINEEFKNKNLSGDELLKWKYQRYLKDYLACILSVDENVGRLLDYLDEKGLANNTLVVYTSDQGFYLGEHGWYDKRFIYEESLGMPLVMRYPDKIKAGQISQDIVLNLDFAPTFLEYTGTQIPQDMQGKSLKSIASGKTPANWRKSMYYHYYEYPHGWHTVKRHYGIRTERYKLVHFYHDIDTWELYDLKNDPNELDNIYNEPQHAELIMSLKKELAALQEKYGDTRISV